MTMTTTTTMMMTKVMMTTTTVMIDIDPLRRMTWKSVTMARKTLMKMMNTMRISTMMRMMMKRMKRTRKKPKLSTILICLQKVKLISRTTLALPMGSIICEIPEHLTLANVGLGTAVVGGAEMKGMVTRMVTMPSGLRMTRMRMAMKKKCLTRRKWRTKTTEILAALKPQSASLHGMACLLVENIIAPAEDGVRTRCHALKSFSEMAMRTKVMSTTRFARLPTDSILLCSKPLDFPRVMEGARFTTVCPHRAETLGRLSRQTCTHCSVEEAVGHGRLEIV
mmetsp:Transcript_8394/g.24970  ORF Transcript_8394/g.24970 Transcript_8394/m.24970 type:complete len:280 (+) Transcript_8394:5209-6048(+)